MVPWDLEKIFSLEIVESDVCLGGASKQMLFFQKNVPPKNAPMPPMSGIGPENINILIFQGQFQTLRATSNICCSLNSFFQLLIGPRNERPLSTFWYQSSDHFKNVDCSTPSLILAKFDLTFRLINDPEKVTPLYRWFKSNLNEIYPLTSSKY